MTPVPGTFEVLHEDAHSGARTGRLWTAHGAIDTPVFMPVGTQATVKAVEPRDLLEADASVILGNTYHLMLRPGMEVMGTCGGLHRFMHWDRPILTDSGGFQVFSLTNLRKIKPEGVEFRSHIDGAKFLLGPKESMYVQRILGSDIAMCFDECMPYPCDEAYAARSVRQTLAWEVASLEQEKAPGQLRFAIVQGGMYPALREHCAKELVSIGFDGYAVGGVSVGEPENEMYPAVENSVKWLPREKPRYVMGLGDLVQMAECDGRRYVRLRLPDSRRPPRDGVYAPRAVSGQGGALEGRPPSGGGRMRLLLLQQLYPRLRPPPRPCRGDPRRPPADAPQPPLVHGVHARNARGHCQ